MTVEFLEHPTRDCFTMELNALPRVIDVPVPGPVRASNAPEMLTLLPMLVRRYLLEDFNGVPRYTWQGWRWR